MFVHQHIDNDQNGVCAQNLILYYLTYEEINTHINVFEYFPWKNHLQRRNAKKKNSRNSYKVTSMARYIQNMPIDYGKWNVCGARKCKEWEMDEKYFTNY